MSASQNEQVLQMLRENDYVTSYMAFMACGITRLAARIYDLKARGHEITTLMRTAKSGARYAAYYLEGKHEKEA